MNDFFKKSDAVSLIGVIFVMVLFSIFGIVGISLVSKTTQEAYNNLLSNQSLFIAEAGVDYVLENQLVDDPDWSDNRTQYETDSISFSPGDFSIYYEDATPSTATILFTGKIPVTGKKEEYITRKIKIDFRKKFPLSGYVIYTKGWVNTEDTEEEIKDKEIKEDADDVPNLNIDYDYYESVADHTIYGDKTFDSGTYGKEDEKEIWYVDGDVSIAEDAKVEINGSIITKGSFERKEGEEKLEISSEPEDPALVAREGINMKEPENVNISGLIYSGGSITLKEPEEVTIEGTIYAEEDINMKEIENLVFTGVMLSQYDGENAVNLKEAEDSEFTPDNSLLPSGVRNVTISENWNEVY